jgi:phosphopantothenoylcysteine decarboxylase/phosphopantothenate--cysteine ligase
MWHKPATQQNLQRLRQQGVEIIGPASGEQACGESGLGRMMEPELICERIVGNKQPQPLQGCKLMITAGPTREPLDPVRYITNRSSGKMGYSIAAAAIEMGAEVVLVSGPVNLSPPAQAQLIQVETAQQMYDAVLSQINGCDIYVGAAAVADYRPSNIQDYKLKKQQGQTMLALVENPDIIATVAGLPNKPFVVGFAAETHDLENYANKKLHHKNLDMIAANWVGQSEGGFDSSRNALEVYWQGGHTHLAMTEKSLLARQLLSLITERWHEKNSAKNS